MPRGGARPGQQPGRPKGSKTKRNIGKAIEAEASVAPMPTPEFRALHQLRLIAKQFLSQAAAEQRKPEGGNKKVFNEMLEKAAKVLKEIVPYEDRRLMSLAPALEATVDKDGTASVRLTYADQEL